MSTPQWIELLLDHPIPPFLRQSVEAAALALVVSGIALGLRRHLSAGWRHGLWVLVFARLLLPGLPVLPIQAAPVKASFAVVPDFSPKTEIAASKPIVVAPPQATASTTEPNASTAVNAETPRVALPPPSIAPQRSMWPIAITIWLVGVGAMLGMGAWVSIRLQLKMRRASRPASPELETLLRDVGRAHGLSRVPGLMICSALQVPALAGWWRPRILLPEGFQDRVLHEDRLRLVLAHELAHWRRRDLSWQLGAFLLLAVHWFNPLLWLAHYRLREEAEAACDEWLLSHLGKEQARAYGDTLIDLSTWVPARTRSWVPGAPGLLGIAPGSWSLRRRILLVTDWMRGRRASRLAGWAGFVLVVALGFLRAAEPKPAAAPSIQAASAWRERVQFHVFDDVDKTPVAGAKLTLKAGKYEHESIADAEGRTTVQLPAVRPQGAIVRVQLKGRVPFIIHWSFEQPSFLPPETLELPLPKAASVGGVVLASDGQPVANAKIALIMRGSNTGAPQEIFPDVWERRVSTDEEGRWHFDEAPPGRKYFSLAVEHPETVPQKFSVNGKDMASFYEGKGQTTVKRGLKITGRVVDESDQPVNATLVLGEAGSDSTTYPEYKTDDQGQFVMTNAPRDGRLLVTVWSKKHAPAVLFWNTNSLAQPVIITLDQGEKLRVRVVDGEGNPIAGVTACADEWLGSSAGNRGVRVMNHRIDTDKDGRFTWDHAPAEMVSWDFLATEQGFRDLRNVRITPGEEETTVKLLPLLSVTGKVTDAGTGAPIPEFRITPGDRWDFEGWEKEGHRSWSWWSRNALVGKEGRLFYRTGKDKNPPFHQVVRVSAPGYAPVISEALDDEGAAKIWNIALKKAPPMQVRVEQPDGKTASGAKLTWNYVRNGRVQIQGGDLPVLEGPEGDGVFYASNAEGMATVPPEVDEFHLVAVHASGWGSLLHAELRDRAVLKLQPWAGAELDVSGLPAELRTQIILRFSPVTLDCTFIDQRTESTKLSAATGTFRDDHLVSGLYKVDLVCSTLFTTPQLVRLEPGEHRKLDASAMWKWCRPIAPLQVPAGVALRGNHDLKLEPILNTQGMKVPEKRLAALSQLFNIFPGSTATPQGGWELHLSPLGLAAGTYRLTGTLKGWPAGTAPNGPVSDMGKVDYTFTIPLSAVGAPTFDLYDVNKDRNGVRMDPESLPKFVLPAIEVR